MEFTMALFYKDFITGKTGGNIINQLTALGGAAKFLGANYGWVSYNCDKSMPVEAGYKQGDVNVWVYDNYASIELNDNGWDALPVHQTKVYTPSDQRELIKFAEVVLKCKCHKVVKS